MKLTGSGCGINGVKFKQMGGAGRSRIRVAVGTAASVLAKLALTLGHDLSCHDLH